MNARQLRGAMSSPEDAATYLKEKAAAFRDLGPRILDMQHRAAVAAFNAKAAGDLVRADQLKELIRTLDAVSRDWLSWLARWDAVRTAVPGLSGYVGIIPVAWAAAVVAVAIAAALIFTRVSIQEKLLSALEAGTLSEADWRLATEQLKEAAGKSSAPGALLDNMVQVARYAVIGAAVYFGGRLLLQMTDGRART